ncbi:MAG: hypothetical protein M3R30_10230 [Candidatus Eremiobacteraeota bacterium]|nr:hypothetical protein [Candidatus Eremiobacteraeota bacterium]
MILAHVAWILLWILVGLGALLALVAPIVVIRPLRGLLARTETLSRAQLLLDVEQLSERSAELARIPTRLEPLLARMQRAQRSLDVSFRMLRLPQAMAALRGAGLAIKLVAKVFHSA